MSAVKLTSEKLAELKEAFMLFDYMKTGRIYSEDVGAVIRSVGLKPSQAQIKAIQKDLEAGDRTVDLQTLVKYISQVVDNPPNEKPSDIYDAFEIYDKTGSGYVSESEMLHVLTSIGEKLTDDEVRDLFRMTGCVEGGRVNYRKFADKVLSG